VFRDSKVERLVCLRGLCLSIMIWLMFEEFKYKGYPHISKYTVWGEISTLAVFVLLFFCSIIKYKKHKYGYVVLEKSIFLDINSSLYKYTSLLF
jgi:hypothetical protein